MEPDKNMPNTDSSNLGELRPDIFYKVDIVVIGAGQAGLSAAYHLKSEGIEPERALWYWMMSSVPVVPGNIDGIL